MHLATCRSLGQPQSWKSRSAPGVANCARGPRQCGGVCSGRQHPWHCGQRDQAFLATPVAEVRHSCWLLQRQAGPLQSVCMSSLQGTVGLHNSSSAMRHSYVHRVCMMNLPYQGNHQWLLAPARPNCSRCCRWGGEVMGRQRAMPHMKSYLRFRSDHE